MWQRVWVVLRRILFFCLALGGDCPLRPSNDAPGYAHTPSPQKKSFRPSIQTIPLREFIFPQFSIGALGFWWDCANFQSRGRGGTWGCTGWEWNHLKDRRLVRIGPPYRLPLYQQSFDRNFRLEFWMGAANPQSWEEKAVGGLAWNLSKGRW